MSSLQFLPMFAPLQCLMVSYRIVDRHHLCEVMTTSDNVNEFSFNGNQRNKRPFS